MSAPETIADVTAEMRRLMPSACADWADRIDRAARPSADALRDWFAGQALAGLGNLNREMAWTPREAAGDAYRIADALLAEREREELAA